MDARETMVRKAEELAKTAMAGRDASHDASHSFRVRDLALSLAREEGLDDPSSSNYSPYGGMLVVEIAALLHDIGDYKYAKDLKENDAVVRRFLDQEGFDDKMKLKICNIINQMGFKNEISRSVSSNPCLEFGIVQDADRLDAIGAVGIARCFTYGGSKNHIMYDPAISPRTVLSREKYMKKDEKQTSINHFHEKLLKLKNLMKTKAGKRKAERRHKFLEDFLVEFYEEWNGRA